MNLRSRNPEQPKSGISGRVGVWNLKFLWTLMFGAWCFSSHAALFTDSVNQIIPDGGASLNTLSSTLNVSGLAPTLSDITVGLTVSGGFNGDLYAYLRSPNGQIAVLLNRVGQTSLNPGGYGDAGFNITLNYAASHDIHLYQNFSPNYTSGQLTGLWQADARNTDPATVTDASSRNADLNSFNGINGNGAWTLVFSDWVTSGDPSTLVSWSLDITAVPEPVNVALGVFGGVFVAVAVWRKWGVGRKTAERE
jgi:subtilisin-like proprotein convertase family protein